ncbi:hypothetical protein BDF22DRAFT_776990 [Syncephalis plumigaleata]|nr:hypothetical protein BDF22DRAFT_776990 [Syncephalis plumigaleata]
MVLSLRVCTGTFDFTLVADVKLESLKRSRKPFSSLEHLLTVQKPKQIMGVPKAFHDLILGQEPAMASYYNHDFIGLHSDHGSYANRRFHLERKHLLTAAICVDAPIPKIFPVTLRNAHTTLRIKSSTPNTFTLTEAKRLLGSYVFVGWPHLRKRKVMYVVSEEGGYRLPCNDSKKKKNPTFEYHTKRDALEWISTIQKLKKAYHRQGILLPSRNNILVYVKLIIEEKHNSNARHGRIQQSFGDIGVILNKKNYGTIVHISKLHPMKSKGIVYRNINGEDTLSNVNSQNALEEYDAEDIAAMEQQQQQQQQPLEEYESATSIASRLNTSVNLINRLTSSIKLYNQDNEDIADIGLKLRMADDKTARIGYSHKDTTGWSYSSEATNIIYEYLHRFPKLIERLGKQLFGVRVRKERLLPDDNNNDELVRIIAWLNTLSCNKNDTCIKMMNTTQLHTKAISRIRSIQPLQKHKPIPIKFSTKTLLNIDCNDTRMRMRLQQFNLGDRVIVIKNNGLVPFGCYGTVIEYEAPLVKLFLDYSFAFAQPIDLSPQSLNRYKLQLDASDVLNITRPQLLYEPTASKPSGNTEDAQKQQATTTLRKITKIAMPNNFQFCFSN